MLQLLLPLAACDPDGSKDPAPADTGETGGATDSDTDGTDDTDDSGTDSTESGGETGPDPMLAPLCGADLPADPATWGYPDAGQPPLDLATTNVDSVFAGTVVCAPAGWRVTAGPAFLGTYAGPSGGGWRLEAAGDYVFDTGSAELVIHAMMSVVVPPGTGTIAAALPEEWLVLEPGEYLGGFAATGDLHIAGSGAVLRLWREDATATGTLDLRDLEVRAVGECRLEGAVSLLGDGLYTVADDVGDPLAFDSPDVAIQNSTLSRAQFPVMANLVDVTLRDSYLASPSLTWTRGSWWGDQLWPILVGPRDGSLNTLRNVRVGPPDPDGIFNDARATATFTHSEIEYKKDDDASNGFAAFDFTIIDSTDVSSDERGESQEWITATGCPRERRHAATSPGRDAATDLDIDGTAGDLGAAGGTHGEADVDWITDDDGDGMPSQWETRWGLDPAVAASGADSDGDGLTDLEEFSVAGDPLSADRDEDGVSDAAEAAAGTCAADPEDMRPSVRVDWFPYVLAGEPAFLDGADTTAPDALGAVTWEWLVLDGTATFDDATAADPGLMLVSDDATVVGRACAGDRCAETGPLTFSLEAGAHVSTQAELEAAVADATVDLIVLDGGTYGPVSVGYRFLVGAPGEDVVFDAGGADVGIEMTSGALGYLTVTGATLHGVEATGGGSALLRGVTVTDSGSTSVDGGGLSLELGYIKMEDVVLRGNTARKGGGLYMIGTWLVCVRCDFVENTATSDGAAAWASQSDWVDIDLDLAYLIVNSTVYGNVSSGGTAGLWLWSPLSYGRVLDSSFVANQGGAALYSSPTYGGVLSRLLFADNDVALGLGPHDVQLDRILFANNADDGVDLTTVFEPITDAPVWTSGVSGDPWDTMDLHLVPGSPGSDAGGWGYDRDGTAADLGTFGGESGDRRSPEY